MIRPNRLQWRSVKLVFATLACMMITYSSPMSAKAITLGEEYPGFSEGILEFAKLEKMDKGLLLKADGFEIKDSFVKESLGQLSPEVQKNLEKNLLFLLEQQVIEKLIKRDAKSMGIATETPNEQMFKAYTHRVTKGVTVPEKDAKTFYDENKDMVGKMPFGQVKESILGVLLQQKKQEALQAHIQHIAQKAQMHLNEGWVKKQIALARDNPLDRARLSGKPTMVQFSASGCGYCEMMKPILKKIKKKYADTINIVHIPVMEHQMLASRFNVRAVPVQVFFDKKGAKVKQHMGFMAEADILKQFKKMGAI